MIFSKTHAETPKTVDEILNRVEALKGESKAQVDAFVALGQTFVKDIPNAIALAGEPVPSMKAADEQGAKMEAENTKPSSPRLGGKEDDS